MTDSIERDEFGGASPEDAFALLSDETRIAIIRALGATPDESLSFSTLRERANVTDSGQFNYHLRKLIGSFVRQTDEDEYELTYAGTRVIGAIFSGTFNQRGTPTSFEFDATCAVCGSSLEAQYEHERVTIACPTCDDQISSFGFPPGAFENRTREELPQAFDGWIRAYLSTVRRSFCLNCTGRIHGSITDESEYLLEDQEVGIEHVCERCDERSTSSIGAYLLSHPEVVAFHHDHGIDLNETPFWELPWLREKNATVLSSDPWCVRLALELDGDRLELEIEKDLSASVV